MGERKTFSGKRDNLFWAHLIDNKRPSSIQYTKLTVWPATKIIRATYESLCNYRYNRMSKTREIDPDKQYAVWYLIMSNLTFELMKEKPELCGDDLATKFRQNEVPPHYARRAVPLLVKSFKRSGHLTPTGRYAISTKSGKPLPTYSCL